MLGSALRRHVRPCDGSTALVPPTPPRPSSVVTNFVPPTPAPRSMTAPGIPVPNPRVLANHRQMSRQAWDVPEIPACRLGFGFEGMHIGGELHQNGQLAPLLGNEKKQRRRGVKGKPVLPHCQAKYDTAKVWKNIGYTHC